MRDIFVYFTTLLVITKRIIMVDRVLMVIMVSDDIKLMLDIFDDIM